MCQACRLWLGTSFRLLWVELRCADLLGEAGDRSAWNMPNVLRHVHQTATSSASVETAVSATVLTSHQGPSPTALQRLIMVSAINGVTRPTDPREPVEEPRFRDGPSTTCTRETMLRSYMRPSQVLLPLPHLLSPSKLACPFPTPAQTLSQVTSGTNAHPMLSTALIATSAPMADVNSSLSFSRAVDVLTTALVTGLLRLVLLEAAIKVPSLFPFQSPVEMEEVEVAAATVVMEETEVPEALLETEAMVVTEAMAAAGALEAVEVREAVEAREAVAETVITEVMEVTAVDLADPVAATGITEINLLSSSTRPSRLAVKASSWLSL